MLCKCYANSESFPYPISQGYLNGSKYQIPHYVMLNKPSFQKDHLDLSPF
jgi:hypothetical protein